MTPQMNIIIFYDPPPTSYYYFPSLTPSHLLNVTKFLVKISQFKFLDMTEKNIFVYKLFFLLNISDFSLFFNVKNATPGNGHPLFSSNPLLKIEILQRLPFPKFSRTVHSPSRKGGEGGGGGGGHIMR